MQLLAKGAEADVYTSRWNGKKAVIKVRPVKEYRHPELDAEIRRRRTLHEASIMSDAKIAGVRTPFVYFIDPLKCEITMEFMEGIQAKDALTSAICRQIGIITANLHSHGIIHGDLTTSNFIIQKHGLSAFDFGLSFRSERVEDMATDLRLIKEVLSSAHFLLKDSFQEFVSGYQSISGIQRTNKILETVHEIEKRGRYARLE